MKRRLQKKLYLGEFSVNGFAFNCSIKALDAEQLEQFFDAMIEWLESRQLMFGEGGSPDSFGGYLTSAERYKSATEEDRAALEQWLSSQAGIADVSLEPLTDAYYGY